MKKFMLVLMVTMLTASFAFAQTTQQLTEQVKELQEQVESLNDRVANNTRHTAVDNIEWGVELRTRVDSNSFTDAQALPAFANDMLGLWLRDSLATTPGDGSVSTREPAWDTDAVDLSAFMSGNPYVIQDSVQTDGFNDAFIANQEYLGGFFDAFGGAFPMLLTPGSGYYNPEFQSEWYNTADFIDDGTAGNMSYTYDPNNQASVLTAYQAGMGVLGGYLSSRTLSDAQLEVIKTMFKFMDTRTYDIDADTIFTNKLRLRMKSRISPRLSFTGRLVMYKSYGDSTTTRFFDGSFKSMHLDGNSGAVPTDDTLKVERAYFVYNNRVAGIPWHLSFGRRPSTYGPGLENRENSVQGGSPLAHIITWNFDGASFALDFDDYSPGLNFKICWGRGYEGDWGTSNSYEQSNGVTNYGNVDDVDFWGSILRVYDDGQYKFTYNNAYANGITDGFIGTVAMPFIVRGNDYNLDGEYEEFTLEGNWGGYTSRFEPTSTIGDLELHSVLAQGENFGFSWFASYSTSKTMAEGRSANPMFQFMEMDELNGGGDRSGASVWVGVMTPELPVLGGKLGVEYNKGSKYWFSFAGGDDSTIAPKLATRGTVTEVYYHQPIIGNDFFMTLGYIMYDYEYTGSGNPLAAPKDIDELSGFDAMMPVIDKASQAYLSATLRY